jgi:hypothetical protein
VSLIDINNRPIETLGTVTLPFQFNDDLLEAEFIITAGISDHLLIGWDIITKFGFLLGGIDGQVFRDPKAKYNKAYQPGKDHRPYMVTSNKIILKPNHQMICQSEQTGGKLPSGIACFLSPSPGLPSGIRLHAFVSEMLEDGMHNLILTNDTSRHIRLPADFPLVPSILKTPRKFSPQNCSDTKPNFKIPFYQSNTILKKKEKKGET